MLYKLYVKKLDYIKKIIPMENITQTKLKYRIITVLARLHFNV